MQARPMVRSSREVTDGNQAVSDTMEVFSQIVTHIQEIILKCPGSIQSDRRSGGSGRGDHRRSS